MSLRPRLVVWENVRFPRVSGDEPTQRRQVKLKGLFSPRERG